MHRFQRRRLTAFALALSTLVAPLLAVAATPGYMACFVNRTGNKARFFHTPVFAADLADRQASARAMKTLVERWSDGRYKLESNCIWHELKAPVENKIADIVQEVEAAEVDTFEVQSFKGATE